MHIIKSIFLLEEFTNPISANSIKSTLFKKLQVCFSSHLLPEEGPFICLKHIAFQITHLFSKVLYRLSLVLTEVEGETLSSKRFVKVKFNLYDASFWVYWDNQIYTPFFTHFATFFFFFLQKNDAKQRKNREKLTETCFYQQTGYAAPVRWSKYTKLKTMCLGFGFSS